MMFGCGFSLCVLASLAAGLAGLPEVARPLACAGLACVVGLLCHPGFDVPGSLSSAPGRPR